MAVTDPIADMLARIRNALVARHDYTEMPASRLKLAVAEVLKKEGYIKDFESRQDGAHSRIRLHLAYGGKREPMISGLDRISKPGLRVYTGAGEIPRVYGGLGIAILSTPQGVMTGKEARTRGVGGEILCYVW
ncbi:MAG TPA: 30S ribosomal protein S8 [Dehalococcoidia bacterium]|jgi:small subunit ribosomal protein S8|nr:30S ribosomal protein S8 [Dehalococcoidia bacterium]